MFQYLDKTTLSYAAIFGIQADTHLVGTDYSWLTSIFYFGYLLSQPLSGIVLQRYPAAKCMSVCVFLWSVILFMHVVCDNWAKLMAVRFFLGVIEGLTIPAFILISAAWWPREVQPFRMGFWFSFNGVAQILGGLLAYGLGHIQSSIESWKWMYLVIGAITAVWSVILFFALPNNQLDAWFLKGNEKRIAIEMIRDNNTGIHNKTFKKEQFIEAITDVKIWWMFLLAFLINIPNSVGSFGNIVISGFGFSSLETTLVGLFLAPNHRKLTLTYSSVCLLVDMNLSTSLV
jgi:MFS family permease